MKVATTQLFTDPDTWVVISESVAQRLEKQGLIQRFGTWREGVTESRVLRERVRKAFEDTP